jgi:23S rRNA pseudouridine2604 synthase
MTKNQLVRLSKLMSEQNICSRRQADRYIMDEQVLVDGEIISELGTRVDPNSTIELLEEAQKTQNSKATILLNKPCGYVSTQPEKDYRPAIDLIKPQNQYKEDKKRFDPTHVSRLSVAGRLDIESKGLLVLTQDGVIAKRIIGENSNIEKEYLVRLTGDVTEEKLGKLGFGLSLDEKKLKRVKVSLLEEDENGNSILRFILIEGKKRQIRRMCELVDLRVTSIKRVRIGNIRLKKLPLGQWRYLLESEIF